LAANGTAGVAVIPTSATPSRRPALRHTYRRCIFLAIQLSGCALSDHGLKLIQPAVAEFLFSRTLGNALHAAIQRFGDAGTGTASINARAAIRAGREVWGFKQS
jgi:hypothetical protein